VSSLFQVDWWDWCMAKLAEDPAMSLHEMSADASCGKKFQDALLSTVHGFLVETSLCPDEEYLPKLDLE